MAKTASRYMPLAQARELAADPAAVAEAIGKPMDSWPGNCHGISLAIIRSGLFGPGRVARGTCKGITSQHSWAVLGDDCYHPDAVLVDATRRPGEIIVGTAALLPNHPHGAGDIWQWGRPVRGDGPVIRLTPKQPLSHEAQLFVSLLGPLDRKGWATLASAPVGGWPAGEIIDAMCDTEGLEVLIPIDIVGMTTDRNPGGLYW